MKSRGAQMEHESRSVQFTGTFGRYLAAEENGRGGVHLVIGVRGVGQPQEITLSRSERTRFADFLRGVS